MLRQHERSRGGANLHGRSAPPGTGAARVLPFDYAAQFLITGKPGTVQQDVINISPEATFVALGMSYGFEQERGRSIGPFLPGGGAPFLPGDLTLGQIPLDVLAEGFRVHPRYLPIVFETRPDDVKGVALTGNFSRNQVTADFLNQTPVFERVQTPVDIDFLFSLVDTVTGREFQDQPTTNIASLGASDGRRPFRMFPRPVPFAPRSTVRLQVIERSEDISGTLFIVLFGYKVVGSPGCNDMDQAAANHDIAGRPPEGRVIPFDYVTRFHLQGREDNRVEDEISVNTEGGYYATGIGYGLQVESRNVQFTASPGIGTINLSSVKLSNFPVSALTDGFRIKPGFMRLAVGSSGNLNPLLPISLIHGIFETLNRAEDVSFRYSIFDSGNGRELQNEPIQNIAGLGIANGDRPFKKLARPLHLEPRSTLRVSIEERFGRGELFIVLQGYKLLAESAQTDRRS